MFKAGTADVREMMVRERELLAVASGVHTEALNTSVKSTAHTEALNTFTYTVTHTLTHTGNVEGQYVDV